MDVDEIKGLILERIKASPDLVPPPAAPRATGRWASGASQRIGDFLHASPFQPFVIRMADGREYRVDHPDFVLAAASDIPQITIEQPDGSQHHLSALLVTGVERTGAAVMATNP